MDGSKRVALVIGASRGMGRQVAIDLATAGYRAREIQEAGGDALAIAADTRDPDAVKKMVDQAVASFGRLDVLIYNSGAIWWASVENTPVKRFKLMQQVNVEGLYSTIQAALPHFRNQGWRGRIVVVSPPIYSRFFRGKTAYAMGKVAMSVLTKGLAMDFAREGKNNMAISSIWVATAIQSAATVGKEDVLSDLRKPTIFSDAVLAMLRAPAADINGCLEIDEDFLRKTGVTDFSKYSLVPGALLRGNIDICRDTKHFDLAFSYFPKDGRTQQCALQRMAFVSAIPAPPSATPSSGAAGTQLTSTTGNTCPNSATNPYILGPRGFHYRLKCSTDQFGGDYRNEGNHADIRECIPICDAEAQCVAVTWEFATGNRADGGRCYFKSVNVQQTSKSTVDVAVCEDCPGIKCPGDEGKYATSYGKQFKLTCDREPYGALSGAIYGVAIVLMTKSRR
ncbi:hypothetical protein SLS54_004074 [Diplodia seriata]